jgi:aminopeptidase N
MPLADESLREAAQAWLDANADKPAALRRYTVEALAGVERALAAQKVDAAR